jgi:hypothetical protein
MWPFKSNQHKSRGLEAHYSGDDVWQNFVAICDDEWQKCEFKNELLSKLNGDLDLAKVIYYRNPTDTCLRIDSSIPALDHLSIHECINSGLKDRVREMLLRMD